MLLFLHSVEVFTVMDSTYAQTMPICNRSISICAPSTNIQNSSSTALVIFNHVNDTLGGNVTSTDFSMIVVNLNLSNGSTHRITQTYDFINGSETGTILQMMPGSFVVGPNNRMSSPFVQTYNITFSGDCHPSKTTSGAFIGVGKISAGQMSNCYVSRTLLTDR